MDYLVAWLVCPGFGWDRVNFLSSSWYSVMFWVQYEKNVDNTLMFSLLLSSVYTESRIFQLLVPSQQEGWRGTRSWEGTQPGQLTPTAQRNVPYHVTSCPVYKLRGAGLAGSLLGN